MAVDRYLRTQYDRVPEPPPRGPRGADKITILEIKSERIQDPTKLANVRNELQLLLALQTDAGLTHPLHEGRCTKPTK